MLHRRSTIAVSTTQSKVNFSVDTSYILKPNTTITFGNIVQSLMSLAYYDLQMEKNLDNIAIDPSAQNNSVNVTLETGEKVPVVTGYSHEKILVYPFSEKPTLGVQCLGNYKLHVPNNIFSVREKQFMIMDGEKFTSFLKLNFLGESAHTFYSKKLGKNKFVFHTEPLLKKAEKTFYKMFNNEPVEELGRIGVIQL